MKFTITIKIILVLLFSITAVSSIQGVIAYVSESEVLLKDMDVQIGRVIDRLCRILVYSVWNLNYEEVFNAIRLEMVEQDIVMIIVRDDHEKVIKAVGRGADWKALETNGEQIPPESSFGDGIKRLRKDIFKDSSLIGSIEVIVTERFIRERILLGMVNIILRLVFLTAITILVLFLTLKKIILRPLMDMHEMVLKLGKQDFDAKVRYSSRDEMGQIADSLNNMGDTFLEYEYSLKNQQRKLEDMVSKIEQQNVILQKLDRLKDDFLTNTSKELRKPLEDIITLSESLCALIGNRLNVNERVDLQMISSTGNRLALYVDDIMDITNIKNDQVKLEYRPVDLKGIVDLLFEINTPLIRGRDLKLVNRIRSGIPNVFADEHRTQQIIQNLLSLSLRCTVRGSVTVSAIPCEDMVQVFIEDTGDGINHEALDKIFSAWENIDVDYYCSDIRIGIGIPLAKKLVELHGGKLSIESGSTAGTVISFTLPVCSESSGMMEDSGPGTCIKEESTEKKGIEIQDNRLTVLVVDDDPVILQVAGNYISNNNYNVIKALDGDEALDLLGRYTVNIVLIDTVMPKTNGITLCRNIRKSHDSAQLPIILMASKYHGDQLVEGLVSGANDYLTKPFSENELMARIRTQLYLSESHKAYTRFVPKEFLNVLGKESIIDVHLGDHIRRKMTIMFSDIRDFTSLSETMTPEENFNFINSFLKRIGPIIRENGGFIDKYIGDSIMALFPESATDALKCSIAMKSELARYNRHRKNSWYEEIDIGIGIHTGNLMLGTIGELKRMEGTVISDAVNLASRLEGLTKIYGASIIISQETLNEVNECGDFKFRFLGMVNVKGKSRTVLVYELLEGDDEVYELKIKTLELFKKALNLFFMEEFSAALECFKEINGMNPKDMLVSRYLSRCEYYIQKGVPEGWDSVEILNH